MALVAFVVSLFFVSAVCIQDLERAEAYPQQNNYYVPKPECNPGKKKGNCTKTCLCGYDGNWDCTDTCPKLGPLCRYDKPYNPSWPNNCCGKVDCDECKTGDKTADCNKVCNCVAGHWACVSTCPPQVPGEGCRLVPNPNPKYPNCCPTVECGAVRDCTPGQTKADCSSTCTCQPDGHWACVSTCPPSIPPKGCKLVPRKKPKYPNCCPTVQCPCEKTPKRCNVGDTCNNCKSRCTCQQKDTWACVSTCPPQQIGPKCYFQNNTGEWPDHCCPIPKCPCAQKECPADKVCVLSPKNKGVCVCRDGTPGNNCGGAPNNVTTTPATTPGIPLPPPTGTTAPTGYPTAPTGYPTAPTGYPTAPTGYPTAPTGYPTTSTTEAPGYYDTTTTTAPGYYDTTTTTTAPGYPSEPTQPGYQPPPPPNYEPHTEPNYGEQHTETGYQPQPPNYGEQHTETGYQPQPPNYGDNTNTGYQQPPNYGDGGDLPHPGGNDQPPPPPPRFSMKALN